MNQYNVGVRIVLCFFFICCAVSGFLQQKNIDQKVNALLEQMTLEEKIGQLNQYTGDNQATVEKPVKLTTTFQSKLTTSFGAN